MRILIKGAGDLATGVAWELHKDGHQVVMTDLAVPLAVRRAVSCSRAIYDGIAWIENLVAERAENITQVEEILADRHIPVLVDPEAKIRLSFHPDVIVDCIMAKRNVNTHIDDAGLVVAIGPGFTAGVDCHCVIETMRGPTLGACLWEGRALPNTGVPGEIAGYTIERLIKASADGRMEAAVRIGEVVEKGQIVAFTGGCPVYSQLHGLVRGMLQDGVMVKKGLKIGDVDARLDRKLAYTISDKSHKIGCGVRAAIERYEKEQ